jgi:hypothetical protein
VFYAALVTLAIAISVWAACTEDRFPWGAKLDSAHKAGEAGLLMITIGFGYSFFGRGADTSAWGWAALTSIIIGGMVGGFGASLLYGKYNMEKQPAVVATRSNPDRGPRSYAPPRIYRP